MNGGDIDARPFKKRRFFVDDEEKPLPATVQETSITSLDASFPSSRAEGHDQDGGFQTSQSIELKIPEPPSSTLPSTIFDRDSPEINTPREPDEETTQEPPSHLENAGGFDVGLFTSVIGERLSPDTVRKIQSAASDNLETAVNMYFDGSWKNTDRKSSNFVFPFRQQTRHTPAELPMQPEQSNGTPIPNTKLQSQPPVRYIGAFGVGGWATRSGTGLLKHGEHVNIERSRSQPVAKRGRSGKLITNQKGDVLTRFTNSLHQEIGRLPRETAEWVSTLIDQRICKFEGVCVFVPDRVRVNDTIYLQLWCYLCRETFEPHG